MPILCSVLRACSRTANQRAVEQGTHNPYRAPEADRETEQVTAGNDSLVLANRVKRFFAALIDALLGIVVVPLLPWSRKSLGPFFWIRRFASIMSRASSRASAL
jgi:hypothetical protein